MKLYTEEQVKYFFECGRNFQMNGEITFSMAQKELTPIELPSDEEIMQVALENTTDINMQIAFNNGAVYICKLIGGQFKTKEK